MDTIEVLRLLQTAAFVVLGIVAVMVWRRHRSRPAAYLALAFGLLGLGFVFSRLTEGVDGSLADLRMAVTLIVLLAFPWLLAAMAWSFEGRLPSWLRLAAIPAFVVAVLPAVVDIFPSSGEPTSVAQTAFLVAYIAIWTAFAVAVCVRLVRAARREGVIRERMRLMAIGVGMLNLAILLAAIGSAAERPGITLATTILSLASAAAFVAGFAPPLLLRVWWRRRSGEQFQRMQAALIGAATPGEVAAAVAPMLAELVGGGVAVIGRDGTVEAAAHVDDEQLARDRGLLMSGDPLTGDVQVIEVDAYWLVVRTTSYTPVFGQGEREIVDGLAIQLRLALERAELFQAHLEARAEAEAASQELEATLMGLSHDLKSPTAAIVGFADLLGRTTSATERDHIVEQIQASTGYLEELVDALLEYSKVGRTQVEVEPVDLGATIASVARRLMATDPGLRIEVDGELPVVLANPVRAEQVFDNLLGNAAKHGGREDLVVTIRAEPTADGTRVLVVDDGKGVSDEDRERVFALFSRGRGATRAGSGVGLGMVRRIVESYGGSVSALPSSGGATFEVTFPDRVVVETGGTRDVEARDRGDDEAGNEVRGRVAGRRATK